MRGTGCTSIKLAKCAWMVCASAGALSPRLRAAGPERCRRVRRCAAARARSSRGAPSSWPAQKRPCPDTERHNTRLPARQPFALHSRSSWTSRPKARRLLRVLGQRAYMYRCWQTHALGQRILQHVHGGAAWRVRGGVLGGRLQRGLRIGEQQRLGRQHRLCGVQ